MDWLPHAKRLMKALLKSYCHRSRGTRKLKNSSPRRGVFTFPLTAAANHARPGCGSRAFRHKRPLHNPAAKPSDLARWQHRAALAQTGADLIIMELYINNLA